MTELGKHVLKGTDAGAVITTQPEELMAKWLSMIPGGRTCLPQELKGVRLPPEPPIFCGADMEAI